MSEERKEKALQRYRRELVENGIKLLNDYQAIICGIVFTICCEWMKIEGKWDYYCWMETKGKAAYIGIN